MLLLRPTSLDHFSEQFQSGMFDPGKDLLERLKLLGEKDRLLVEMALKHRLSVRQMGSALGLSPGSVTRRLRRLVNRLNDPLVTALLEPACPLAADLRQLGIEYFLERLPVAELARRHERSRHEIRTMLEYLRGWHRGASARR